MAKPTDMTKETGRKYGEMADFSGNIPKNTVNETPPQRGKRP